jgi:hypothetical protein
MFEIFNILVDIYGFIIFVGFWGFHVYGASNCGYDTVKSGSLPKFLKNLLVSSSGQYGDSMYIPYNGDNLPNYTAW